MEQIVWVYVGVIAIIVALAAIGSTVVLGNEQMKEQQIYSAINLLKERANFVCNSEVGTLFSEKIILGSGVYLHTGNILDQNKGRICIDFEKKTFCETINCEIPTFYDLNLDLPELREIAYTRQYVCFIERVIGGIKIGCKS